MNSPSLFFLFFFFFDWILTHVINTLFTTLPDYQDDYYLDCNPQTATNTHIGANITVVTYTACKGKLVSQLILISMRLKVIINIPTSFHICYVLKASQIMPLKAMVLYMNIQWWHKDTCIQLVQHLTKLMKEDWYINKCKLDLIWIQMFKQMTLPW